MKLTAVECMVEQLTAIGQLEIPKGSNAVTLIIEQAKALEKEQIIEAHGNKQKTKSNPNSIVTYGYTYTGEMYYNEVFKGIKTK